MDTFFKTDFISCVILSYIVVLLIFISVLSCWHILLISGYGCFVVSKFLSTHEENWKWVLPMFNNLITKRATSLFTPRYVSELHLQVLCFTWKRTPVLMGAINRKLFQFQTKSEEVLDNNCF